MPLHDWTRVPAGLLHNFHQSWSIRIVDALNGGLLPSGVSALVEQRAGLVEPDVLAIESPFGGDPGELRGGTTTVERPVTRIVRHAERQAYADRANRIVLRHHLGRVLAVVEIVSPGHEDGHGAFRRFVEKTVEFLRTGVHVLIVDPFPPTPRDPAGVHQVVWDELAVDEEFEFPPGQDRLLASYECSDRGAWAAFVETLGVGDSLPEMPIFLAPETYVPVPLEATYSDAWAAMPNELRKAVETGELPGDES